MLVLVYRNTNVEFTRKNSSKNVDADSSDRSPAAAVFGGLGHQFNVSPKNPLDLPNTG